MECSKPERLPSAPCTICPRQAFLLPITLLTPGSQEQVEKEAQSVPVDTTEQPGMGKAIGHCWAAGWVLPVVRC